MGETSHWGYRILQKEPEAIPDVAADIELSMNKFFLNELEEPEDASIRKEKLIVPPLNPLMLHAVGLHHHANGILEMIKLQITTKNAEKIEFKLPIYSESETRNTLNLTKEDFRTGNEMTICDLSKNILHQVLVKCIATLFAQIGYETSQQSALNVLVDVLQDFFKKICHHMKIAFEDEEAQYSGFPHVFERVLTEMGLGGVKSLDDYYQSHVIKYVEVLETRCQQLAEKYQTMLIPKSPSPVDKINKIVRVKVEEEDVVEVENPEVHFSTIDGDVNFSILETGYQLLNSLEAEANLQSMTDGVEDITVTESPGVVSIPSDDISHLSPYSKKKRFK